MAEGAREVPNFAKLTMNMSRPDIEQDCSYPCKSDSPRIPPSIDVRHRRALHHYVKNYRGMRHHALLPRGRSHETNHHELLRDEMHHEMGDYAPLRHGSELCGRYRWTCYCGSHLSMGVHDSLREHRRQSRDRRRRLRLHHR